MYLLLIDPLSMSYQACYHITILLHQRGRGAGNSSCTLKTLKSGYQGVSPL